MKKGVIGYFFVIVVLFSIHISAQINDSEVGNSLNDIDRAYQCLEKQIDEKSSLSLQEAVFGTLALGIENKLIEEIDNQKRDSEDCWPKSGCRIKDTAQVLLAYDRIGKNLDGIKTWLLSKGQTAKELIWFLEVDITSHSAAECIIKYDTREYKIEVNEDMTLTGNTGSCLSIAYGGYWLRINDNCVEKDFEISCTGGGDFVTTLVHQKKSGGSVFVSSETHSGVDGGSTNEKVNSRCFGIGNTCDYEGTLWASLALDKIGEDTSKDRPYLLALSENNNKYLPSAFLYILTNGDDQYSDLVEKQKLGQYWDVIGSPYNRYYDTSLALLGLVGSGAGEVENSQDYLLNVQTNEGCWNNNNIRDTSFVLYSSWPKKVGTSTPGIPGGEISCESSGNYCQGASECFDSGGIILDEFQCTNFKEKCCTVPLLELKCFDKGGIVCSSSQQCENGRIESSIDGSCCIGGTCVERQVENFCILSGGSCQSSCLDSEETTGASCPSSLDVCCVEKDDPDVPDPPGISLWIIILIVLILLVILGIVFRHKLQMWFYRKRRDRRTGKRPPPPGHGRFGRDLAMRPRQRYGPPGTRIPGTSRPSPNVTKEKSPKDKEMEETMRKLREISG